MTQNRYRHREDDTGRLDVRSSNNKWLVVGTVTRRRLVGDMQAVAGERHEIEKSRLGLKLEKMRREREIQEADFNLGKNLN